MTEIWARLVAEFEERTLSSPTPRTTRLADLPGKADALVGMRRVGKTWRLFQHLLEQQEAGTPRSHQLYVNLEDERLDVTGAELSGLLDAWYARFPEVIDAPHWLYLDEVQNAPGWERFVRRLLDEGRVRVLVTGSSSKLLSTEIATSLRGRAIATEILPFSFFEALRHAGEPAPAKWPVGTRARAKLRAAWRRYFETGGFPEVQGLDAAMRRRVLQEYVDVALLRDVVERHGVTQVSALRWLVRRLLANPAGRFTANRLHRDLKSQGFGIGKDTVHELLAHLEDAHLTYAVPLWTPNAARRQTNPRKAYAVDPALSRTAAFAKPEDVGHRLETLVYLELRRRGMQEIGYYETEDGYEVDFCARDPEGHTRLVQVSHDIGAPSTRSRELRALESAMQELDVDEALLVTNDEEGEHHGAAGLVRIAPAWMWALQGRGARHAESA